MRTRRGWFVLFAVVAIGAVASAGGDDPTTDYWPAWRGPMSNGVAPNGNPPVEWSETENLRWKVELPGAGHSTPVVWGDRIYVLSAVRTETAVPTEAAPQTETATGHGRPRVKPTHVHRFVVSAIDRASGKSIWETVVREEVPHESGHETASQASASPVTDGKHVWASFGSRGLYCLDREGKVKWEKDLGEMRTRNEFGEGASPVLHGDTLVLNWDHEGDSFIVALDKLSGEERWKVARDEPTSWSTPLVVEDGGRALVVTSGSNFVRAYDLTSGKEIWRAGGLGLNCIPAPVADDQTLFLMSGYREAAGMAIRYRGAKGDITEGNEVAWRTDEDLSYVPSPLLYDGKLYFLKRFSGILSCYDLSSGKALCERQRLEGVGDVYSSLVGAGGRIYVLGRDGAAVVFRHGEGVEILATNKLDDAFDASPVIAGDDLYLRGHTYLYSVGASRD